MLLDRVLESILERGMRQMSVSPSSGAFLTLLVSMKNAKKVLEIGALGGYSGIHLARGFGENGCLTSLELKQEYADLAFENMSKAGFGDQVNYLVGPALEGLQTLKDQNETFDFFFIDADKGNYQKYLDACVKLATPGAVIVSDNVLVDGTVAGLDGQVKGFTETMKKYNEYVASHPQLQSIILPIGDGMTVSIVLSK